CRYTFRHIVSLYVDTLNLCYLKTTLYETRLAQRGVVQQYSFKQSIWNLTPIVNYNHENMDDRDIGEHEKVGGTFRVLTIRHLATI
ncbi:MAG: hypothetical protein JKX73_03160, partial [Flavobacteriales bacterium]|nr:hypothetical protein [Flavobacteriales bacterium]